MMREILKWALIAVAGVFLGIVIVLPVATVVLRVMVLGRDGIVLALTDSYALAAFRLTFVAVGCALILNTIFGLSIAWYVCQFPNRLTRWLIPMIDLPLALSPVVSGMLFVMMLGYRSWIGSGLGQIGLTVIFSPVAVVIVTTFVTLPFMARELILLMQSQGNDEEIAALMLGASGWQLIRRISIPNLLPALISGGILTIARGLGEFGAVSVVSGHIRGYTETAPLYIESLVNDYLLNQAYVVAVVLMSVSVVMLGIRYWAYRQYPVGIRTQ